MENTVLYAVIKLSREIIVGEGENQEKRQLTNCYGFLPVFETYEQAFEYSENGVFQIVTLHTQPPVTEEIEEQVIEPNENSDEIQVFE
jgi:hypothetical protein